jgi:hypothetical protein
MESFFRTGSYPNKPHKEKKMIRANKGKFFLLLVLILIVTACEPVSVSVNSKGQIAFTRSEGAFFLELKTGKITTIDWNFGKDTVPAIVRWAPNGESIALTIRDNINSQETKVYVIDKKNTKKQMYETSSAVTQMEWSPDGSYLSIAQAGADTDMSVADLVLVTLKDGSSKIIVENSGDVHSWIDAKSIAHIKVIEKNADNSDILKCVLAVYTVTGVESKKLTDIVIAKTTGIDFSAVRNELAFTAIKAGDGVGFDKEMKTESSVFLYNLIDGSLGDPLESLVADYVKYSPDSTKLLVKALDPENYGVYNLEYWDLKKNTATVLLENTLNSVSSSSGSVQVYPTWFDNGSVLYWRQTNTYGSNAQAVQLMSVNLSTKKRQNHQLTIDNEINKLVEAKGGY